MESGEEYVGDGRDGPVLRGLGRVLGDLASLGYDAGNRQLFLRPQSEPHPAETEYSLSRGLLPTPRVSDHTGAGEHGQGGLDLRTAVKLLPTPTSERPDSRKSPGFAEGRANFFDIISNQKFGQYAPAIERWEAAMGRAAPEPTGIGPNGKANLSARFVEWMMGQSDGWVTDDDLGLSRVSSSAPLVTESSPSKQYSQSIGSSSEHKTRQGKQHDHHRLPRQRDTRTTPAAAPTAELTATRNAKASPPARRPAVTSHQAPSVHCCSTSRAITAWPSWAECCNVSPRTLTRAVQSDTVTITRTLADNIRFASGEHSEPVEPDLIGTRREISGAEAAEYAKTPEGQAFIARCRGPRKHRQEVAA